MENPIAVLGQTSKVRSLFSMFEGVNNPWISSFIATIPERFSDALGRILCHQNIADDFVLSNRLILKDLVRKFHFEADTLTNSISKQIGILEDPKSQILVSTHQPNLFAYGGVFRKIVLLETLKRTAEKLDPGRKIINLFLVVDHDFVDESWVRLAQLPSVRSASGVMELRFPISN